MGIYKISMSTSLWTMVEYTIIPHIAGLVPAGVICGGIGYARWRAPKRWKNHILSYISITGITFI
jgi:hypothetical protein